MQDSEDGAKNDSSAEDSDNDGMDVDDNIPKSSKGIQSFTSLNGEVILSRVAKDIIIIFERGRYTVQGSKVLHSQLLMSLLPKDFV